MNKKVKFCIHGASSLIGKSFCLFLLEHHCSFAIFARSTSNLDFLDGKKGFIVYRYNKSISELIGSLPKLTGAIFVDLAWDGVFGTEKNNIRQITVNIPQIISSIELAKYINAKGWVGFGSQAEYGNINCRVDEKFSTNPITLYGKAKLMCSVISAELCSAYGLEHSWLRLFSAYGPHGNHKWFIDYLIEEMKNDRELNITKCEQCLDYLHVDDISNLLFSLEKKGGVGVANLGSGKATKLRDVVEIIRRETKSKSIINYGAVEYKSEQGMFNEADITKLSRKLGWKPQISIEKGLVNLIDCLKIK